MKAYYDQRAPEYDDWYHGTGMHASIERPGWHEEVARLTRFVGGLSPGRTLDVACGTGFLTRHLHGEVVALDHSPSMLRVAAERAPLAELRQADALPLPFEDESFDRVFTAHFYGHLEPPERARFLAEARRVAAELVVVDAALHEGVDAEQWQPRKLLDGSRHVVYKRYFSPAVLAEELGGGTTLFSGSWFVAVSARNDSALSGG